MPLNVMSQSHQPVRHRDFMWPGSIWCCVYYDHNLRLACLVMFNEMREFHVFPSWTEDICCIQLHTFENILYGVQHIKTPFSRGCCLIHKKVLWHMFLHWKIPQHVHMCVNCMCVCVCVQADNFSSWRILLLSSLHSLTSVKWLPLIMPLTTALQFSGAQSRDWE